MELFGKLEEQIISSLTYLHANQLNVIEWPFNLDLFLTKTLHRLPNARNIIFENMLFNSQQCAISLDLKVDATGRFNLGRITRLNVQLLKMTCLDMLSELLVANTELLSVTILSFRALGLSNLSSLNVLQAVNGYHLLHGIDLSQNEFKYMSEKNAFALPMGIRFLNMSLCRSLISVDDMFFNRFPYLERLEFYDVGNALQRVIFASQSVFLSFDDKFTHGDVRRRIVDLCLLFECNGVSDSMINKCPVEIDLKES